jgi:hypothetical protein
VLRLLGSEAMLCPAGAAASMMKLDPDPTEPRSADDRLRPSRSSIQGHPLGSRRRPPPPTGSRRPLAPAAPQLEQRLHLQEGLWR